MTIWRTSYSLHDSPVYSTDWEAAERRLRLNAELRREPVPEIESEKVNIHEIAWDDIFNGMGRNDFSEVEAREFLEDYTPEEHAKLFMTSNCCSMVDTQHHFDTETTLVIHEELVGAFKDAYEGLIEAGRENDRRYADL